MERRTFLELGCTCGIASLCNAARLVGQEQNIEEIAEKKKHVPQAMYPEQVKSLLKFVDSEMDEATKQRIFSKLGNDCFYTRNLDKWIGNYTNNVQALLDWVNIEKKSKYWEKLEFNPERTTLTLIGRKVEGCACAFADCEQPPKSLCFYCCKNFQQELFGYLLGQKVTVEITTGFLLGDERCNTLIHLS